VFLINLRTQAVQPLDQLWTTQRARMAWSPDGAYLAVTEPNGGLSIWEPQNFTRLSASSNGRSALAWSPDGNNLLTGQLSDSVGVVYQPDNLSFSVSFMDEGSENLTAVAWPTAEHIISAGQDGTIRYWQSYTETVLLPTPVDLGDKQSSPTNVPGLNLTPTVAVATPTFVLQRGRTEGFAASPDGKWVAVSTFGLTWIYEVASEQVYRQIPTQTAAKLVWSNDSARLIIGDNPLQLWYPANNLLATKNFKAYDLPRYGWKTVLSPDGFTLASGGQNGKIEWIDLVQAQRSFRDVHQDINGGQIWDLAWSPVDNTLLASVGNDATLRLTRRRDLEKTFQTTSMMRALAWAPDGSKIAVAGGWGEFQVWDVENETKIVDLVLPEYQVAQMYWKRDGSGIYASASDGAIHLLDATSGRSIQTIQPGPSFSQGFLVDWMGGGDVVLLGSDQGLQFWNLADGQPGKIIGK